jgi:hypothetical protein
MADAITGFIGIVIMLGFLGTIVGTLGEPPLTIASIIGVVLMLWGFWKDALAPVLRRSSERP